MPAHSAHTEITNMMLNTAEPITPLIPMSSLAKNTPITTVASSGAEEPAAMKVAPATSGDSFSSATFTVRLMNMHNIRHCLGKSSICNFNRVCEKCFWDNGKVHLRPYII